EGALVHHSLGHRRSGDGGHADDLGHGIEGRIARRAVDTQIVDHHPGAAGSQAQGMGATKSLARTGDNGHAAVESYSHGETLVSMPAGSVKSRLSMHLGDGSYLSNDRSSPVALNRPPSPPSRPARPRAAAEGAAPPPPPRPPGPRHWRD